MKTKDVLFFDKDHTLGEFSKIDKGLYPRVIDFLNNQFEKGIGLYIATDAGEAGRKHLEKIDFLLDGYFGREKIGSERGTLYVLPDGNIRRLYDDYCSRCSLLPEKKQSRLNDLLYKLADMKDDFSLSIDKRKEIERRLEKFWKKCGRLVHSATKEPFDDSTIYVNPNAEACGCAAFSKDIYLAKRLIDPVNYSDLRSVMVGDFGDEGVSLSDPETPLIVISNGVRSGEWHYISSMVDRLFSSQDEKPWQVYDRIFAGSSIVGNNERSCSLDGLKFRLKNRMEILSGRDSLARLVYCE